MLRSYSLIARAAADVTVPFLVRLFSERVSLLLSQVTQRPPMLSTLCSHAFDSFLYYS